MNLQKISFGPNLAKCIIDENLRLDLLKYGEIQKVSAKQQLAGRIQKEFFFDSISKQKVESRVISYIENYLQTISQFEVAMVLVPITTLGISGYKALK